MFLVYYGVGKLVNNHLDR